MKNMPKRNIAVVCGGYSGEYEVSLRSADNVIENILLAGYNTYKVVIEKDRWFSPQGTYNLPIDKSDFSVILPDQSRLKLDYAYITIHGTPGEDGVLQGYFDMLGVPYNTGGMLCESLTFNKEVCNRYLSSFGIRIAPSCCLRHITEQEIFREEIEALGLPVFVKPNVGGSSIATTKVTLPEQLAPAIKTAFSEGKEVLIERFIQGIEVTCGCLVLPNKTIPLPVTEVVAHSDFFDYDAKYNGLSDEITPARLPEPLYVEIQQLTAHIARWVRAQGLIRVDYIIEQDGHPTLLEVNTTPGMTATSFIPQQVVAAQMSLKDIFAQIIESHSSL